MKNAGKSSPFLVVDRDLRAYHDDDGATRRSARFGRSALP
jgi:hypothetical protein